MTDEAQQPGQVVQGEPGPVGEQVEGALLGGLEQGGQHVVGDSPSASVLANVVGHGSPRQGPLGGKRAPGVHPVDGVPQADGGVDRGQPPHPVAGGSRGRVALDGEDRGGLRSGQQPAGVAQPGLVGDDQEDAAEARPLFEPPEPLGEARTVGGVSLPDDGDGAPSGEGDGGVHRHGPVPAESDGVVEVGDGGGEPVDDGHGVEPLQEEATPLGRDGAVQEEAVHGDALLLGQSAQPCGGEVEPAGGRGEVGGVGDGGGQPLVFQPADGPVDRAPGPAGDGDRLQPVEEGHVGQ